MLMSNTHWRPSLQAMYMSSLCNFQVKFAGAERFPERMHLTSSSEAQQVWPDVLREHMDSETGWSSNCRLVQYISIKLVLETLTVGSSSDPS